MNRPDKKKLATDPHLSVSVNDRDYEVYDR
jgi:hypothetical protein